LGDLAAGARRVALTIPDLSRACPNDEVLTVVLDELNRADVPDAAVTVLIGCGLHRTTDSREKGALVGAAVTRVRVEDAQGQVSPSADLGTSSLGCPVRLHAEAAAADLVISVGVLEPHLYAGYSGVVKGVAIGCAAEETIAWTHDPRFISRPGVELCNLDGNPFQTTLREIAGHTLLGFAVTVVMNDAAEAAALSAGDPVAVQRHLAARFAPRWLHQTATPYDVIVAGIKAPKHESLYQASRAATYIGLAARPALVDGGLLLLCTDLPLGAGDGPGEINFARVLAGADPAEVIARGLRGPLGPGGQRAFVLARVLQRFRVGVCGAGDSGLLSSLGIRCYRSIVEGVADARAPRHGHAPRVLAIADALTSLVRAAAPAARGAAAL
jgi:nickel-dependent lactate racemase